MKFARISLQPGYGARTCAITWDVDVEARKGRVYLYRSLTGSAPWQLLNPAGVVASVGYYVDRVDSVVNSTSATVHYRLALELEDNAPVDSPPLGICGRLTPREYRTVTDIMWAEVRSMRSGNGIPAFVFAPLREGIPAPGFDFETYQMGGTGMSDPTKPSFGEAFVGGFGPPVITWLMKLKGGEQSLVRQPDGTGTAESTDQRARMLAFPRPQPNYLIVLPQMDERFTVGEHISAFLFKGILPIGYEVPLVAIPRTDPRYRLPVPEMPEAMYATL